VEKMPAGTTTHKVVKVVKDSVVTTEDLVVEEVPLTIYLNGQELVTMLCSPGEERYLVLGFLVSEGMIDGPGDLSQMKLDLDQGLAWVETTVIKPQAGKMFLKRCLTACCGKGRVGFYYANDARVTNRVESDLRLTVAEVLSYQVALDGVSESFHLTGGVHGGALAAGGRLVRHSQDIGRHNVFDKLYGYCLDNHVATNDKVIVFTGRVSSEIVLKVSKMSVPVIIARSAPTSLALGLAEELGITVIGFARGDRLNVYTYPERLSNI